MNKIGILTFHYSNNYGAVLQCMSLQKTLTQMGLCVEIINFIPSSFSENGITKNLGIRKNIFKSRRMDINLITIIRKIIVKNRNNQIIIDKFNKFRDKNLNLGVEVNEKTIQEILNDYDTIIVGSDQIWNPSQRDRKEYFLDFKDLFKGIKISYAADSTIKEIDINHRNKLEKSLNDFSSISVRNNHSYEFVKSLINKNVPIVADPTILYDFNNFEINDQNKGKYILAYILGKEIKGSHKHTLEKIKKVKGNLPVYFIVIPTMNFSFYNCADKVLYDLGPKEWLTMFKNASFIYTDSYHGVLFSIKYHKPFLAYYTEKMRSTRFIDLGNRYNLEKYIVDSISDIDKKKSLENIPDFKSIDKKLEDHKKVSIEFLKVALKLDENV